MDKLKALKEKERVAFRKELLLQLQERVMPRRGTQWEMLQRAIKVGLYIASIKCMYMHTSCLQKQ